MIHGVLLIALFACASFYIGEARFLKELSISPMIIGIILGNVVYFWRRAERIERELDELREQRIAHAREKNKENDNLFV